MPCIFVASEHLALPMETLAVQLWARDLGGFIWIFEVEGVSASQMAFAAGKCVFEEGGFVRSPKVQIMSILLPQGTEGGVSLSTSCLPTLNSTCQGQNAAFIANLKTSSSACVAMEGFCLSFITVFLNLVCERRNKLVRHTQGHNEEAMQTV